MRYLSDEEKARNIAMQWFDKFNEFICYGKLQEVDDWFNFDSVILGFRFAYGQYMKKGAYRYGIPFDRYCQALSSDIGNGVLVEARKAGVIPKYKRCWAEKYQIGKGCGGVDTGEYGYE